MCVCVFVVLLCTKITYKNCLCVIVVASIHIYQFGICDLLTLTVYNVINVEKSNFLWKKKVEGMGKKQNEKKDRARWEDGTNETVNK